MQSYFTFLLWKQAWTGILGNCCAKLCGISTQPSKTCPCAANTSDICCVVVTRMVGAGEPGDFLRCARSTWFVEHMNTAQWLLSHFTQSEVAWFNNDGTGRRSFSEDRWDLVYALPTTIIIQKPPRLFLIGEGRNNKSKLRVGVSALLDLHL